MARQHRRPPEGTGSIVSRRTEALRPYRGRALADAAVAGVRDPDVAALTEAFEQQDREAIGAAIERLRPRYSKAALAAILRNAQQAARP